MRIIAGKWRGRRIEAPPGRETRPILDRAKTVLFDVLGHRLAEPGRLPPIAVLDLYAGSGALGLEALSRGAGYCAFVERHPRTARLIRRNLDTLGIISEGQVVEADASMQPFPRPEMPNGESARYTLVFVDPPYRMLAEARPDPAVRTLLRRLATDPIIDEKALMVVRHADEKGPVPDLSPLEELDRRVVGTMVFRLTGRPRDPADGRHEGLE